MRNNENFETEENFMEDDAPEIDENWAENAYLYEGDTLLRKGSGTDPFKNK